MISVRRRRSSQQLGSPGAGAHRLSALPDDLLLLVLAHLPCASAAARTGVLARRWRGLWSRLRRVVLCDVPFPSLKAALARVSGAPPAVSLIEIDVPKQHRSLPRQGQGRLDAAGIKSLLSAAARLEPEELVFALKSVLVPGRIDLPRFHRTTAITLDMASFLHLPAGAELPALETLSLSRCIVAGLTAFIPSCPRLRTIRLRGICSYDAELSVSSASLQQLVVEREQTLTTHVNIMAPMLKQLTMSFNTLEASISVLAPMVEKVSWRCSYTEGSIEVAHWRLHKLMVHAAEAHGQLPSLHIHACISSSISQDEASNFTQEIEKHFVAAFSVLELHLETKGHAYGAFVFHVLEINRICCAIQRLKVDLQGYVMEKEEFLRHCLCDSPNWKSQTISLTALEEVEISGFDGKDHDFDLLEMILICAPMLQRMVMKLSQEASASEDGCTKIYNIFTAYSSVQCYVYLSSGLNPWQPKLPIDMILILTFVDSWANAWQSNLFADIILIVTFL